MLRGISQNSFECYISRHRNTAGEGQNPEGTDLSGAEDEFVSPESNEVSDESTTSSITNLISSLANRMTDIFNIFSPLLSFIKNLTGGSKEEVIQNFSNLLRNTEENISRQNLLSEQSRQAIHELSSVVSNLHNHHENINLGQIIAQWRDTRDAQHLLQAAEHLERGRCVSLNESELRELRESFIRGLRTLSRAIRDAENRGEHHAAEHLRSAADPLMAGVERAHETSQREDSRLTTDEKQFMGERLQESCECINEGTRNGVFNRLDQSIVHELNDWTNYVYDFLKDFFEWIDKQREEDEKAKKEEQCKKRCEEQERIRILHALHKRAENKKLMFLSHMKKAMMEAYIALKHAQAELNKIIVNRAKYHRENEIARKECNNSLYAENMYKKEANRENSFEYEEQRIISELPPASVCEHEFPLGFIFDVHC